jgi:hypothetical protein
MSTLHKIYVFFLAAIVVAAGILLVHTGLSYYTTSLDQRFFHPDHVLLKPSGMYGHGMGILGTLMMVTGVLIYMIRKRMRSLARLGILKHWLEMHIFLCTLGPLLVLFHTSFKFGGLVAISFWSMVAVFVSGIIGRFIYIQIPRSIEGRELSLNEIRDMKQNIGEVLTRYSRLTEEAHRVILESTRKIAGTYTNNFWIRSWKKRKTDQGNRRRVRYVLKQSPLTRSERKDILNLVKNEISLNRRIDRLVTMQNLFRYWHVAHLPFALVMLVIMVIHVAVTILFGYRWIF